MLCIIVVVTRQQIFGLLTHEQAHYLGVRSRYGDWICNALASYPLLVFSVENYAKIHLTHHRHYFTEKDPDYIRKNGKNWLSPFTSKNLIILFTKDLLGLTLIQNIIAKNKDVEGYEFVRKNPTPKGFKISYYIIGAMVLTLTHAWVDFLLYWVLPLATVLQVFVRWGALCEHIYGDLNATVESNSPVILNRWWEKLLLPNLNFTLHPYHHYFPGVSYSQLPKLHAIFIREGLVNQAMVFKGYGPYLRFLCSSPKVVVEPDTVNN